jgi:drug/metabolite transporter (DMT)-like permease
MIGMSCVFVSVRYLRKVHYGVVMVAYGYVGSLECILVALIFAWAKGISFFDIFVVPREWEHLGYMSLVAIFSMIGQTLLVLALQYENAGPVSLLRTCDIIFNFVLQYFINGDKPDMWR